MKRKICVWFLTFFILFSSPPLVQAGYQDTNRFTYGFQRILRAPFQIPIRTIHGTMYGPLVTGTLGGVMTGAFRTVSDLVGGGFDMAAATAPYAKYAIFFV